MIKLARLLNGLYQDNCIVSKFTRVRLTGARHIGSKFESGLEPQSKSFLRLKSGFKVQNGLNFKVRVQWHYMHQCFHI